MSETVKAVVTGQHTIEYITGTGDNRVEVTATAADGVIELSKTQFDELEALGSVRKASSDDKPTGPSKAAEPAKPEAATK
ncbi:hypothetical protein AEAC466_04230 [Asticcacaulis sp. AC466]|uniref:hypothetical protein n=1 Tax=Asticcacaulis sp. AC466 TaxID=1282362 RepID=UPI0003C3FA50|nr:hypothetical protein [Asticcacaulis sp. AC466]ESQ85507.1 hypothetical protein AEAC466_04230 [Asticcacaulis sp. AC466]